MDQLNQQRAEAGKPPLQQKKMSQGAATSVWGAAVAAADEVGGLYCENCHVAQIVPYQLATTAMTEGVRAYALDLKTAEALWKKSEEMVTESF